VVTNGKNGAWYRLKGCGSYGQGFPLEDLFPETKKLERQDVKIVTGCFTGEAAALRELHMTEIVNTLLEDHGLVGGNIPLGYWNYCVPHNPPVTVNDTPDIPKVCALFRTLGDKRFGTHMITGLERLLPLVVPGFLAEELLDKFPASRMDASVPGGVLRTHQHIFDHVRLNKGDAASPPSDEGLINLVGFMLPERVPEGGAPSGCGISNHHTAVWDTAAESLSTVMSHGPGQAGSDFLAHVVWHLGREAGNVRKIMNENDIMWGYFFDHNPNEAHNNSDPSNLVLLPKGTNGGQLLAPIDFDMCYTRSSFLIGVVEGEDFPTWPTEENLGTQDMDKFDRWQEQEAYLMEMAIGGNVDNYVGPNETANVLMTALRDTCLLGFRSGLRGDIDPYPLTGEYLDHVYDIIELALCLSDSEEQITRF